MLAKTHYLVTANRQGYSFYNYLGKAIASNTTHSLKSHDNSVEAAFLSRVVTYNIHALTKLLGLRLGIVSSSRRLKTLYMNQSVGFRKKPLLTKILSIFATTLRPRATVCGR